MKLVKIAILAALIMIGGMSLGRCAEPAYFHVLVQRRPLQNPLVKVLPLADPSPQGPSNADQVLMAVYDSVNSALRANATLSGGSANPGASNADQILTAVYDAVNGALKINCVAGCATGTSLTFGTTNQSLDDPPATASGQCLVSFGTGPYKWHAGSCVGTASTAWADITAGTNAGQALIVGAGSSLTATGGGVIAATSVPIGGIPTFGSSPAALVTTKSAGADPSTDNCVKWLAGGALGDAGAACGAAGAVANLSNLANPTAINLTTLTFAGAAGITASGVNSSITFTPTGTGLVNGADGFGHTDSLLNAITAARTYYVCGMANGSTCVSTDTGNGFNGNAAAAATIADTNNCTTVTTPCRSLAGVQAKISGKRLNAIVTVYAADTANTGTDCYSPDSLIFTNPTMGRNPQTPNLGGRVESYPAAYLYLYGNPTTPANATIAKTCGSATIAANFAIGFDSGTTARINGFQVEGYGTTHIGARPAPFESLGGSALYVENITAIGNKQNSATDKATVVQASGQGSVAFMGGTHTVSNMGWFQASNGGMIWTYGPANDSTHNTVLSMTGAASDFVVMDSLEDGKVFFDRVTSTFAGNGAYYFQQAMLRSTIIYTESYTAAECPTKCVVTTLNAPNAIFAQVAEGSFIDNDLCGTWSEGSCTVTQQPATRIVAKVLGNYRVTTANSVTAADQITSGGCIETFTIAGSKDAAICAPETVTMTGTTSGSASIGVAAAAGTPNKLLLPTASGSSGQFLKTDGANPQQLSWGDAAAVVGAGTAGVGPAYVGDATTAARSNHDHRSLHMLSFFMPGTPATGIQRQALVLPAGGVNFAITDMQVVVTTTSGADSAFNIQRCTANCTTGSPTFSSIYSTDLTLAANNRLVAKGSAPNQNVTSLVAGDQFRAYCTTIGASLSDVTVVMVVKWNTTN